MSSDAGARTPGGCVRTPLRSAVGGWERVDMRDGSPLPRGRRFAVRALLVLGTLLAIAAIAAVFANRQVLNADNWADTSSALLEDEEIRAQFSTFLVDAVYANVDVEAEIAQGLPPRTARLAGPIAGGLRTFAERTTNRALGRPRFQEAWENANRVTAQQFIAIAEGESKAITQSGDAVVLDVRVILVEIIGRLGLPSSLADKIPPDAGAIKVMSADQVETAKTGVTTLRSLAVVLPVLALLSLGLAVYLARGRRRKTLLSAGIALILAGIAVLVLRSILGEEVTSALATTDTVQPAADQAWSISTRMLRDVAQATIIGGIPIVAAAVLAGPTRPATWLRRMMAPWLRDRPGIVYGVVGTLVALVVLWGPIPATQRLVPVLIMIGLVILGVEVLRRQTAREFPDATADDTWAALRPGVARLRGGTSDARETRVDRLERLERLHDTGALTDEEFAAEKAANGTRDRGAVSEGSREPGIDASSNQ
jgi:hypothetical protein